MDELQDQKSIITHLTVCQPSVRLVVLVLYTSEQDGQQVEIMPVLGVEIVVEDGEIERRPLLLVGDEVVSLDEAGERWPRGAVWEIHPAYWPVEVDRKMFEDAINELVRHSKPAQEAQKIANQN